MAESTKELEWKIYPNERDRYVGDEEPMLNHPLFNVFAESTLWRMGISRDRIEWDHKSGYLYVDDYLVYSPFPKSPILTVWDDEYKLIGEFSNEGELMALTSSSPNSVTGD